MESVRTQHVLRKKNDDNFLIYIKYRGLNGTIVNQTYQSLYKYLHHLKLHLEVLLKVSPQPSSLRFTQ